MLPFSRALSNPWIILEQVPTLVVKILAGPLSVRFVLYDFNVSFENSKSSWCIILYHLLAPSQRTLTSDRRRFDVDITSIRRRPNFDEFPRHFHVLFWCNVADWKIHIVSTYCFRRNFAVWKVHVISTYFFQCNFDGRNIHVVSTYFFRCNFDVQKIHVVSTYFFQCNFDGQTIQIVSTYFFQCNFDGRKIHVVSTYFFRCNFFSRNIHGVSTYYFWRNFDGRKIHEISMGKNSTSFLVSCKPMKTFDEVFLC